MSTIRLVYCGKIPELRDRTAEIHRDEILPNHTVRDRSIYVRAKFDAEGYAPRQFVLEWHHFPISDFRRPGGKPWF